MSPNIKMIQPIALIILLMVIMQWSGMEYFRYETNLIHDKEWWRLLSGHWVHANWMHLLLNACGLLLCLYLTAINWSMWQWSWRILFLSVAISVGFLWLHPNLGWYVGFSGVLSGLYILSAIETIPNQSVMSYLLLIFVVIKILLEQFTSLNLDSSDLIGVPVLVDAHLYGVLSAFCFIGIELFFRKMKE